MLMRNGVVFWYHSDGGQFEMDGEIVEAAKMGSLCTLAGE